MFVHKNVGNRVEGLCSIQYFRKGPNDVTPWVTPFNELLLFVKGEKIGVTGFRLLFIFYIFYILVIKMS